MEKLIITAALTGAENTREATPHLPITPREIAADARRCMEAGASIVHVHARREDGTPTQDKEVYREIIHLIRQECPGLIIQVSTGGAVGMTPEERLQPVSLAPDMATLSAGSVNFGNDVFLNPPQVIQTFARAIVEKSVTPEIEVFEAGMIDNALRLVKAGILALPLHFDFVLGVPGGMGGTPEALIYLKNQLPPGCTWTVAGVGRAQLPLAAMAIILGGHVRVGLEDNIYYRKGELAANAQLVERVVRLAAELGRQVASPMEARKILNIDREVGAC
jgi:3-keto-5-aminohexanoate cleavage enzyme